MLAVILGITKAVLPCDLGRVKTYPRKTASRRCRGMADMKRTEMRAPDL